MGQLWVVVIMVISVGFWLLMGWFLYFMDMLLGCPEAHLQAFIFSQPNASLLVAFIIFGWLHLHPLLKECLEDYLDSPGMIKAGKTLEFMAFIGCGIVPCGLLLWRAFYAVS